MITYRDALIELAESSDLRGTREQLLSMVVRMKHVARSALNDAASASPAEDSAPLGWSLRKTDEQGGKEVRCYWADDGWTMGPIYRDCEKVTMHPQDDDVGAPKP